MLLKSAGLTKQAELSPEILDSLSLIKQDAIKALGSGNLDKAALESVADKYLSDSTGFLNTHLKNAGPDAKALREAVSKSVAEVSDAYALADAGKPQGLLKKLFDMSGRKPDKSMAEAAQRILQQAQQANVKYPIIPYEAPAQAPKMSQDMLKKLFDMSSKKPDKSLAEAAQKILQQAQHAAPQAAAAASDPFAMYGYGQQMMQQAASKGAADSVVQQAGKVGKNLHGGFGALIGSLLGGATNEGHRTSGAIGGGIGGIYGAKLSQLPKFGTPGKIATGIVGATGLGYGGGKLGALLGRVLGGNE